MTRSNSPPPKLTPSLTRRNFVKQCSHVLGTSLLTATLTQALPIIPSLARTMPSTLHAKTPKEKRKIHANEKIRILIYTGTQIPKNFSFQLSSKGIHYRKKLFAPINSSYGQTIEVHVDDQLPVIVNGNGYAGKIIVVKNKGVFSIVNELDFDTYLMGVVKKEISASWPDEAIRTQTIAARSYAYDHLLINPHLLYHMSATTHHQVFGGSAHIPPSVRRNVIKTHGVILMDRYEKVPVKSFFHACCGGITEKAENVWPSDKQFRFFKHIRCHYCTTHPLYSWKREIPRAEIHSILSPMLKGKIINLRVQSRTRSKRVKKMLITTHDRIKHLISGEQFRQAATSSKIPSTRLNLKTDRKNYLIDGRGYGHGVGLCQWGAKTMAEKGHSARSILGFYYQSCVTITIDQYTYRYGNRV